MRHLYYNVMRVFIHNMLMTLATVFFAGQALTYVAKGLGDTEALTSSERYFEGVLYDAIYQ